MCFALVFNKYFSVAYRRPVYQHKISRTAGGKEGSSYRTGKLFQTEMK